MKLDLSSFSFVELERSGWKKEKLNVWNNLLGSIISASHREQKNVDSQRLCKRQSDGD